uniref:Uncharacterized protein n=1 Tax=Salmo trutta TaxID=8032 RepID=A0A674F423_SALTR
CCIIPCCNILCCLGNILCCLGNILCCLGNIQCCLGIIQCCLGKIQCCLGNIQCCLGNILGCLGKVYTPFAISKINETPRRSMNALQTLEVNWGPRSDTCPQLPRSAERRL